MWVCCKWLEGDLAKLLLNNSKVKIKMQLRATDRSRKQELPFGRAQNANSPHLKHHLLQPQDLGATVRRHSVFGTAHPPQEYLEGMPNRISSKELKSLQKYGSRTKHEADRNSL
jgi:hypothetical protein